METISRKQLEQINETLKQVNIPSKEDWGRLGMEEANLFNAISSLQTMIEQTLECPVTSVAKIICEAEKHHITVEYNAGIYTVMLDTPFSSVKYGYNLKCKDFSAFLECLYGIYDSFSPAQESMKLLTKDNGYFKDSNKIYDIGEVFTIFTACKDNLKNFIQVLEKNQKKYMKKDENENTNLTNKDSVQNDKEWLIKEGKKLNIEIDIQSNECKVTLLTPNQLTFCRKRIFNEGRYLNAILQTLQDISCELSNIPLDVFMRVFVFDNRNVLKNDFAQAKNNIQKMIDIVQKRIVENSEQKKG